MDIASRLDQAMSAAGFPSQNALSRASGVPQPTINRLLKGVGKKGPEAYTVAALAEACNVSFEWLHTGNGPMERAGKAPAPSLQDARAVGVAEGDSDTFVQVPLVEMQLQAGVPGFQADPEYGEHSTLSLPRYWVEARRVNPAHLVALRVKGDSMYPTLREGYTVIVNTADREPADGAIFAVNYEGKALVKRLERDGGTWYLSSDNPLPEYKRRVVRDKETIVVGRVIRMEGDL
jgi:phage repressor protein C with HTH and peptisase S24 domain